MSEVSEAEVYSVIGEEGFTRLVAAFYRRVPSDPVLGVMYPRHDFVGAEARLRGFLIQRFGGPDDYSQKRGHPRLRMRHAPFRVDAVAREHWLALMEQALVEVKLPEGVAQVLWSYFQSTATFMMNAD